MVVTSIEKKGKYKYFVKVDEEFVFWLSWKELYFWNIKEGQELSEEQYSKIMKESILGKCKRKAVSYLKISDRTENELRQKLRMQDYVEPIIEETIAYLKELKYLDDDRFVDLYITTKQKSHSKKWIEMKLKQKGIKQEQIGKYMESTDEEIPLRREIEKKLKGECIKTRDEKEKIMAYLYRKGYSVQVAKRILEEYENKPQYMNT